MGNGYDKLNSDQLIGKTITNVYHTIPYQDTIDFEGTYEVAGKLSLTVIEDSPGGKRYTKQIDGRYYLPGKSPLLTMSESPLDPNILLGRTVLACERFVFKKGCIMNHYRYRIQLDNEQWYQLDIERLRINPR